MFLKKIPLLLVMITLSLNVSAEDTAPKSIHPLDKEHTQLAEYFNKKECVKRCNGANRKCYQDRNPLDFCKKTYNHCLKMCDKGVYTYRKGFY
jgi:hypothetical protein